MKPEQAFNSGAAVITGAGSGIGEALAKLAASYGMSVVVADISQEGGERVVSDIKSSGGDAIFVKTDVSDAVAVDNLADIAYKTYGDVQLLINNAGIGVMGNIWEISADLWEKAVGVNILGPIHGVRAFAPRMLKSNSKTYIANVASLASLSIAAGSAPYISSKHQLLALTESLYVEMQDQPNPVNVSIILPGVVTTGIMENQILSHDKYKDMQKMMGGVLTEKGMPADEAAEIYLDGIAAEEFWITSHPEVIEFSSKKRAEHLVQRGKPFALGKEIFD